MNINRQKIIAKLKLEIQKGWDSKVSKRSVQDIIDDHLAKKITQQKL